MLVMLNAQDLCFKKSVEEGKEPRHTLDVFEHKICCWQAHQREDDTVSGAASHRTMTSVNRKVSEKRPKILRTEQEVWCLWCLPCVPYSSMCAFCFYYFFSLE